MTTRARRWLVTLLLALALPVAVAAILLQALLATLAPTASTWSVPVRARLLGRAVQRDVSVPVLLRLATHPLAAAVIDGRHLETAHGRWHVAAAGRAGVVATCAPCRVAIASLGPTPLPLERVQLAISADGADQYHGTLQLGTAPHALTLAWRAHLDRSGRMQLEAALPRTPLHDAVQVFGHTLAERGVAQVQGTLALTLRATLPEGPWRIQPQLAGFTVQGLGTERLLDLQRPAACRNGADSGVPALGGWLPRAVVAAEDQRFFDHPGYDLAALTDAWQHNQRSDAALAGASTLTQQLAKLVYTGEDRSAARKLRELLYAVEMERTLGKARILQLYLALAPWGDGICGADRAARVHLGQPDASALGPVAAAWLASLLPRPDALLRGERAQGQVDNERVARVLEAMRPMSAARREKALATLPFWSPPGLARPREGSLAAPPSSP